MDIHFNGKRGGAKYQKLMCRKVQKRISADDLGVAVKSKSKETTTSQYSTSVQICITIDCMRSYQTT